MCDCKTDAGWMQIDFAVYCHEHLRIYKTNITIDYSGYVTHMHAHESVHPTYTQKLTF